MNSTGVPFFQRQKVKEIALILGVILFFLLYSFLSPLKKLVDLVVDPAVAGLTVAYGHASTFIHRFTGANLGFVQEPPDQEFIFAVRLATYVNERQAKPLLELATDQRVPVEQRERALRALLKFQNTGDWVQPFLNELPKGGMLGLYDKNTPVLDELFKKIRAEGGLRQPLVRAYAEVVFSFMLQVPDAVIRSHALRWVSDVIAEDAVFLIVPRIDKEQDPEVQAAIEAALLDVRAISDPETAREMLVPFYKKPPWPSLRFPMSVVLTRLGYDNAREYLAYAAKNENLGEAEMLATRVALAKTRFPRELRITENEEKLVAQRAAERRQQLQAAMQKRERMMQQERMKRALLARRMAGESPETVPEAVEETAAERPETAEPAPVAPETEQIVEAPVTKKPAKREAAPAAAPVDTAAAERAERLATAIEKRRAAEEMEAAARTQAKERAAAKRVEKAEEVKEARLPETAAAPEAPKPEPPAERAAPKPFSVPGELTPEEKAASKKKAKEEMQLARLPEDVLPPPLEQAPEKKPRSLMNYVDVVFEAKQDVPVYANPGEKKSGSVTMPKGTKGKAEYEVMIGDEKWLQVKTKKGSGWAQASKLDTFNLRPDNVVPVPPAAAAAPADDGMGGARKESTYFEPTTDDVPVYGKPSERAKVVSTLKMNNVYLAVKSEKVGANRWFQLQLRSGETGWVLGDINLQLANVMQPNQQKVPNGPLANHEPWFAAGWIQPGVKGVGVYARTSMGSELLMTIDPGQVFRVVETSEGGGSEWYRIQISGKQLGWVQAMDVKITKEPEK